jgi:hypothetical protein
MSELDKISVPKADIWLKAESYHTIKAHLDTIIILSRD